MTERHLSEAALIALLDGQGEGLDPDGHLAACDACGARLDEIGADAERFARLYEAGRTTATARYDDDFLARIGVGERGVEPAVDRGPRVPRRPSRRPFVAAALAAGIASLLLVPPVRAWIVDAVGGLFAPAQSPVTEEVLPAAGGDDTMAIRAGGPTLRLVVEGRPAEIVVVDTGADEPGWARITAVPSSELTALPDGFRVDGVAGASVRLSLPGSVTTLQVALDGVTVWSGAVPRPLGEGWVLPFDGSR